MSGNKYIRRGARSSKEPKIGRMFLFSLGLHLLLFLVFSGALVFRSERDPRPVYYVDLTQLPVANPQAGRPDARPKTTKKTTKKPVKKTVKKTVSKAPVKKTPSKPKPKPLLVDSDAEIQKKLAKLQEKQTRDQEYEELKAKLAALASGDNRTEDNLGSEAPLGVPDGQGDEAGASFQVYLQAYLKEQWSLSRLQVRNEDAETRVRLVYSRTGKLVVFEVLEASGESKFDESVKMAILKGQQLPFEPQQDNWTQDVTFNLKDLLDR